jgi:broad specificity phosphatase PhoE
MKLYLTRHTRTNYNELDLCNADPSVDVHLSEVGLVQAKALAKKLQHETFDIIITSQLPRTTETANIINEYHHVPVVADGRINDNASGFEGKPVADYFKALEAAPDMWDFRGDDGESINDLRVRVAAFLDDLAKREYAAVLVVSHQSVLQAVRAEMRGLDNEAMWAFKIEQGNFTTVEL